MSGVAPATAATQIDFWHAFTGRLGELLDEQVAKFNDSQSEYTVVATNKGNYSETLNAGIAAFRAGEQPHILQVFEVGTATMMGAKGAIARLRPDGRTGKPFDPDAYLAAVKGYYTTTDGEMLSLPYNSSTPVLYVNRDALEAAGLDPDMDLTTWEQVGHRARRAEGTGVLPADHRLAELGAPGEPLRLSQHALRHEGERLCRNRHRAGLQRPGAGRAYLTMGEWAKDGKFIYAGRRNEGGARFRSGECALFTESSAGYAGVKAEATFDFDIRRCLIGPPSRARRRTPSSAAPRCGS
jgi:sn-glycerol 3-phosphate transport system substrate-binding protein